MPHPAGGYVDRVARSVLAAGLGAGEEPPVPPRLVVDQLKDGQLDQLTRGPGRAAWRLVVPGRGRRARAGLAQEGRP